MKSVRTLVGSGIKKTGKKLDKDRFRHDLGGVEEAYGEVMKRACGQV